MLKRTGIALILVFAAIAGLYLATRPAPLAPAPANIASHIAATSEGAPEQESGPEPITPTAPAAPVADFGSGAADPGSLATQPTLQSGSSPAAGSGNTQAAAPEIDDAEAIEQEIENVRYMVRGYRDVLGENPVGTNAEITRALMGDNEKQVKMPLPAGSHLNAAGELADRWGTPYFFHQLSALEMEVRSAGPDQEMWSGDDVVTR